MTSNHDGTDRALGRPTARSGHDERLLPQADEGMLRGDGIYDRDQQVGSGVVGGLISATVGWVGGGLDLVEGLATGLGVGVVVGVGLWALSAHRARRR